MAASRQLIAGDHTERSDRHEAVLAMQPVGYWPADEGKGEILQDRSGNDNHGKIFQTPWADGLLDFTSRFEWAEIPSHATYQSEAFTIGGWLFSRRGSYKRKGMLFMGIANPIGMWKNPGTMLRIREGSEVEVVSDGQADAIGSMADKDTVAINQWQHVLYTYAAGTGKLYVNGQLVQS
ncbi:unnamed protein product, partial [marine sediment metagenome]